MNKVASLDTLFSPNFIAEKLFFIFNLFLPFLPFVWLGRRTERFYFLLLGVVPQLLLVAISNFPEMWKPLNYYGMVPSLILGVAAISVIASVKDRQLQRGVLMIAIFISFTQSGYKPARTLFNLWASDSSVSLLDELPLRVIPQDKRIIATPAASLYLFDHDFLWQLDKANKLQDLDFDFIVTKRSEEALISSHLRQVSAACADQSLKNAGDWLVLCRVR